MLIDLNRLEKNYKFLKEKVEGRELICVVKADGYGHGALEITRKLYSLGSRFFAVAIFEEALELRKEFDDIDILVLGALDESDYEEAVEKNISITIHDYQSLDIYREKCLKGLGKAHIKVDTGMHRIGFSVDEIEKYKEEIISIKPEGIFTHLAKADEKDKSYSIYQIEMFKKAVDMFEYEFKYVHFANTAAIMEGDLSFSNTARAGIGLYGLSPFCEASKELHQIASIKSKIVAIRFIDSNEGVSYSHKYISDSRRLIATIPLGYADGYKRNMTNKAKAFLNGKIISQVGTITMDQVMFDVTDVDCSIGDEIELLGDNISTDLLAELSGTINYEVMTSFKKRLRRIYC